MYIEILNRSEARVLLLIQFNQIEVNLWEIWRESISGECGQQLFKLRGATFWKVGFYEHLQKW